MNKLGLAVGAALLLTACGKTGEIYTLYRSSIVIEHARIHVATFDANLDKGYNLENCELAARLFQQQPGVTTKFWCEKGEYRS